MFCLLLSPINGCWCVCDVPRKHIKFRLLNCDYRWLPALEENCVTFFWRQQLLVIIAYKIENNRYFSCSMPITETEGGSSHIKFSKSIRILLNTAAVIIKKKSCYNSCRRVYSNNNSKERGKCNYAAAIYCRANITALSHLHSNVLL